MPWCATHHRPSLLARLARRRFEAILRLHRQQRHSRFHRAAHTRRQAATQIEPQECHGIDLELIDRLRFVDIRASILRDFAGLESLERICGPLPDQTRIRLYFWNESDSGVPSIPRQNLLAKRTT